MGVGKRNHLFAPGLSPGWHWGRGAGKKRGKLVGAGALPIAQLQGRGWWDSCWGRGSVGSGSRHQLGVGWIRVPQVPQEPHVSHLGNASSDTAPPPAQPKVQIPRNCSSCAPPPAVFRARLGDLCSVLLVRGDIRRGVDRCPANDQRVPS